MNNEQYAPSPEELQKAEDSLTEEERESSIQREKETFDDVEKKYEHKGTFVVQEARKVGVSPKMINEYALRFMREEMKAGYPDTAHRFMQNMEVASEEDFQRIAREEFGHVLENFPMNAPDMAEIIFGKQSKEYKNTLRKVQEIEARDEAFQKQVEKEGVVYLSPDATLKELLDYLTKLSEEREEEFYSELHDNYSSSDIDIFLECQQNSEKAATTKIKDVFGEDLDLGIFQFKK